MNEIHSRQPGFTYSACGPFDKKKKEHKNLKKQKIQDISTEMNQIKLAFSIIWLMEILKIYQEEQVQVNYYVIKYLILLKQKR